MESEAELSEVQKRIRALNRSAVAASKPRKGSGGHLTSATGKLKDNPFVSNDCPAPSPATSGGETRSFRTSGYYSPTKSSSEPVATRYSFSPSTTTAQLKRTSPAQPSAAAHPSPTAKSSVSTEKSQLFKTARLLQKMSFESESSSILSQTQESNSADRMEESEAMNAVGGESDDELDASAALKYWKNRGTSKDGPISFRDAKKIDLKPSVSTNRTTIEEDADPRINATPGFPGGLQSENSSQASSQLLPSPPDIFRTVQVQSAEATYQEGGEQQQQDEGEQADQLLGETMADRSGDSTYFTASTVDSPRERKEGEAEGTPAETSRSKSYCAYGKRSRLRSHRPAAGSHEPTGDHDVASVVSSSTAHTNTSHLTSSSQHSSLSSRATRFLRDKRKGGVLTGNAHSSSTTAACSEATEAIAKDITHNLLRDKVSSKNRLKQRLTSPSPLPEEDEMKDAGDRQITTESPFDEPRTEENPIDSAVPNDEVRKIAADESQKDDTPMGLSHAEDIARHAYQSIQSSNQQYTMLSSLPRRAEDAPSTASSAESGNYSKLKAKDRFDAGNQGSATAKAASPSRDSNVDIFVSQNTGKPFDDEGACKPLEMLGPLSEIVETAYNALSPASLQQGLFQKSGATLNDAPSDEDVAIEVEYVEQHEAEDPSFATETDGTEGTESMFTESTRDSSFL